MDRLTTEIPQSNFEMVMNYVYDKNHEAFIRSDGEKDDVPLCEYIDKLCKAKGCDITGYSTDERCRDCSIDGNCTIAMMYLFASQAVQLRGRLRAYEDAGLTPQEIKDVQEAVNPIPFGRFHDIMEAELNGRLAVLPCKVGDPVHITNAYKDGHIMECHVTAIEPMLIWVASNNESWGGAYTNDDFGKTVFLTSEEAKAAVCEWFSSSTADNILESLGRCEDAYRHTQPENEPKHDCDTCVHQEKSASSYPCNACKNCYIDQYAHKPEVSQK